ncbi:hypothetical protein PAAG_01471 [Paracoccidioides lutzii Pb01]|uniref:Uncharacterized protein n=1 Tax=Paracoccidioides lutzii (strain ATCC MYA-826 / Pb01) TaxID=502779 RepID=C1GSH6_PARBA|nr:hypothetical protein PAAG_01471 [Paracoccidioides lutzii Pb01]EEH39009.2 hypothetical protein PAAG_01471 [Paracoccidioides lutzii Pb01]
MVYSPSTQEWLKPTAILKQIQLPDYWEAERRERPVTLCVTGIGDTNSSPASSPGQITEDNPVASLGYFGPETLPDSDGDDVLPIHRKLNNTATTKQIGNPMFSEDPANSTPRRPRYRTRQQLSNPSGSSEESKTNSEPQILQSVSAPVMESIISTSNMPPSSTTMNQRSLRQNHRNTINDNRQGAGTADAPL